mmetsp:Transcript_38661/g.95624  ORF Transcript_38661/g.95624 Transcript_38661/m.95624 type:complete len:361 (+) Transcript_38661:447-1529(+)
MRKLSVLNTGPLHQQHGSLHVLCGHKKTNTMGIKVSMAWNNMSDPTRLEWPGVPFHQVRVCAAKVNADIVLLDLHPDMSPLNCMLLMSSDYYLNPVKADSPSLEAMSNLLETMVQQVGINVFPEDRNWHEQYRTWVRRTNEEAVGLNLRTPIRKVTVKFMGIIINDYVINQRGGFVQGIVTDDAHPVSQDWMNSEMDRVYQIAHALQHPPALPKPLNFGPRYTIAQVHYDTAAEGTPNLNFLTRVVGKAPNWAGLSSIAQMEVMPVAFLTDRPGVYQRLCQDHRKKVRYAKSIYNQIAWNILYLASGDNPQLVGALMQVPLADGPGFSTVHAEEFFNHIAGAPSKTDRYLHPNHDAQFPA